MKLYAYCFLQGIDRLPESVAGISGLKVRLLESGDLSLLVSDYAGDIVPVTRENALAHAAVVRSVLDQTTPLPFRFGTLISEQELAAYITAHREALQARLSSVGGCVEMSVKIIWDRQWSEESAPSTGAQEKPGTAYLSEKRREILGSETRVAEAKKIASWLEDQVSELVRERRIDTNPTGKLLVAAHLVERHSVQPYRSRLAEGRAQRPELHFLISGPWPPYSFADIDLEFKSQFGVS